MAVLYYKYKSSKDFHYLPIDAPFISVSTFKNKIWASRRYGHGNNSDLLISDARTEQQFADVSSLIPANSSVLIRRLPKTPGLLPIVVIGEVKPRIESNSSSSVLKEEVQEEGLDFDDFGPDIFINPTANRRDTRSKETKIDDGFKTLGKWWQIPPKGYVCHRCNVGGHYIQHCPTNGDPKFDCVRVSNTMNE